MPSLKYFLLALCGFNIRFATLTEAATTELDNAAEYGILCKIYRLLEYSPSGPYFNNKPGEPEQIVDEIVYLANSSETENFQNDSMNEELRTWRDNVGRPKNPGQPRVSAQYKLLVATAQECLKTIVSAKNKARQNIESAQRAFAEAIYGSNAKVEGNQPKKAQAIALADTTVFSNTAPATTCGAGQHSSTETGKTLVNDFFCLCVGAQNSAKPCANGIATHSSASGNPFYTDSKTSVDASWDVIKGECPISQESLSEQTIVAALAAFRGALGRGVQRATDSQKIGPYILGEADAVATGCTGANGQYCVNYKENLKPGGKGIPWEGKILEGIHELRLSREQEGHVNHTFLELRKLVQHAKHLYIEVVYEHGRELNTLQRPEANGQINMTGSESIKSSPQLVSYTAYTSHLQIYTLANILLSIL